MKGLLDVCVSTSISLHPILPVNGETRNEGVLELYGILLAVMCYVLAAPSSQFSSISDLFESSHCTIERKITKRSTRDTKTN